MTKAALFLRIFEAIPWITLLPNRTQDKLKGWCFFSWHSIEDPFKSKCQSPNNFENCRNSLAKEQQSRCLLHADWMHSLALPNQRGVTAWLWMSFQNVTNSIKKSFERLVKVKRFSFAYSPYYLNLWVYTTSTILSGWGPVSLSVDINSLHFAIDFANTACDRSNSSVDS